MKQMHEWTSEECEDGMGRFIRRAARAILWIMAAGGIALALTALTSCQGPTPSDPGVITNRPPENVGQTPPPGAETNYTGGGWVLRDATTPTPDASGLIMERPYPSPVPTPATSITFYGMEAEMHRSGNLIYVHTAPGWRIYRSGDDRITLWRDLDTTERAAVGIDPGDLDILED